MLISLIAVAVLAGSPDPEGVVNTARAEDPAILSAQTAPVPVGSPADSVLQAHGLTTDQQIDRWLESRGDGLAPFDEDGLAELPPLERRMHGEVSAGIGTHGYRSMGASVDIPVGESSWLSLDVMKTEGRRGYPYDGYGWPHDDLRAQGGVSGRFSTESPPRVRAED